MNWVYIENWLMNTVQGNLILGIISSFPLLG